MEKKLIIDEFESFVSLLNREEYKGGSFNPFKYYKQQDGKNIPVFFIGSPGVITAIAVTFVTLWVFFMITLPFNILYWLISVILSASIIRIALKADKSKQMRAFFHTLCIESHKLLEKAEESNSKEDIEKYILDSEKLLKESLKFVEEPIVLKQIEHIAGLK